MSVLAPRITDRARRHTGGLRQQLRHVPGVLARLAHPQPQMLSAALGLHLDPFVDREIRRLAANPAAAGGGAHPRAPLTGPRAAHCACHGN